MPHKSWSLCHDSILRSNPYPTRYLFPISILDKRIYNLCSKKLLLISRFALFFGADPHHYTNQLSRYPFLSHLQHLHIYIIRFFSACLSSQTWIHSKSLIYERLYMELNGAGYGFYVQQQLFLLGTAHD